MRFFLIGLAAGVLFLFLLIHFGLSSKTEQPISFSHKKHQEQGIDCLTCHPYYQTQTFAGMPSLATCLGCHQEAITQSPEEEKIRQLQKKGEKISWKRLYQEPDHVFFSHRRHVVLGKLNCQTCHGQIGESQRPPSWPWVSMSMKWCMNCHARHKATNDCIECHV